MYINLHACLLSDEIPNNFLNVNIRDECFVRLEWLLPKTERVYFPCLVYIPKKTIINKNGYKMACLLQVQNKYLEFHSKKTRKKLNKLTKYEQILFGNKKYTATLKVAVYELYPNTIEINEDI